jgi:hypothetical protein
MRLDVEQLAARWVLGMLPSTEMPGAAAQALVDGHDGPALRELAGEHDPILSAVQRVFERALGELQAPSLCRRDAALLLAHRVCERVTSGKAEPYVGAKQIWALQIKAPEVGHALDPFVYWANEFEEAEDSERRRYCEAALLAAAKEYRAA